MFASSIIGGLISFSGTFLGAYIVGFAENLGIFLANYFFGTPLEYRFRPQGLLPERPVCAPALEVFRRGSA